MDMNERARTWSVQEKPRSALIRHAINAIANRKRQRGDEDGDAPPICTRLQCLLPSPITLPGWFGTSFHGVRTGIMFTLSVSDAKRLKASIANPKVPQKHLWRTRLVLLSGDGVVQGARDRSPDARSAPHKPNPLDAAGDGEDRGPRAAHGRTGSRACDFCAGLTVTVR